LLNVSLDECQLFLVKISVKTVPARISRVELIHIGQESNDEQKVFLLLGLG